MLGEVANKTEAQLQKRIDSQEWFRELVLIDSALLIVGNVGATVTYLYLVTNSLCSPRLELTRSNEKQLDSVDWCSTCVLQSLCNKGNQLFLL